MGLTNCGDLPPVRQSIIGPSQPNPPSTSSPTMAASSPWIQKPAMRHWSSPDPIQFAASSPDRVYTIDNFGRLTILNAKTGARAAAFQLPHSMKASDERSNRSPRPLHRRRFDPIATRTRPRSTSSPRASQAGTGKRKPAPPQRPPRQRTTPHLPPRPNLPKRPQPVSNTITPDRVNACILEFVFLHELC